MHKNQARAATLFVLPYLAFLAVFVAYPIGFAVYLVFQRWDLITPPEFVGLRNFRYLARDQEFWRALYNTLVFLAVNIPLQILVALLLAWILSRPIAARTFFRAVFFLPVVISGAVVTLLWQELYATKTGLINHVLHLAGLKPVPWLTSPRVAMPAIALMVAWKNVGFYIVLFLAGILAIPEHLYEAAKLEGAGTWQEFRHITWPLLRPTLLLVAVLSTISAFNLFVEPYVMTGGGPMGSTMSIVLYMYKHAFFFQHMGYAAAIGVALAALIMAAIGLQKKYLETENPF